MSDLLIKGMKMPKTCERCPLVDRFVTVEFKSIKCKVTKKLRPDSCLTRPNSCPLVEIPSHGGLIEKNAVFKLIQSMPSVDKLLPVEFMKALYEIPTIIQAEEGE